MRQPQKLDRIYMIHTILKEQDLVFSYVNLVNPVDV